MRFPEFLDITPFPSTRRKTNSAEVLPVLKNPYVRKVPPAAVARVPDGQPGTGRIVSCEEILQALQKMPTGI
jgi:hypothetical protein